MVSTRPLLVIVMKVKRLPKKGRTNLVEAFDQEVLVRYQDKTEAEGVDRSGPYPVNNRKVAGRSLIEINGEFFSTDPCLLQEGWSFVKVSRDDDREFWSFRENYEVREPSKDLLQGTVLPAVKELSTAERVNVQLSDIEAYYLESKTKGEHRSKLLSELSEQDVVGAVCDALEKR